MRHNLAEKWNERLETRGPRLVERESPRLEEGWILEDGRIQIQEECLECRRAFSCLVLPEPGDRVLVSVREGGVSWILAVLDRESQEAAQLRFEGDVLFRATGRLSLEAVHELDLSSAKKLDFAAKTVDVRSEQLNLAMDQGKLTGNKLNIQLKSLHLLAMKAEQVFQRLTQRLGDCFRFVKDHDETQARSSRTVVDELHSLQAKNTLTQAQENAVVQANQIHLG